MIPHPAPDPSGKSWTKNDEIAAAIDRSHACNGGMVVLVTTDGEDYQALLTEFAGICHSQKHITYGVWEYTHPGDTLYGNPSPGWAIQLTLV